MKKIQLLHWFIQDLNLFAAEQMESFVDDLVITPSNYVDAFSGHQVIAEKDYSAGFYIERYPHKLVSEDQLIAQISAWLMTHDPERTEPISFALNVEVLDASTANLEFSIPFNELILAKPLVDGNINIGGESFTLA